MNLKLLIFLLLFSVHTFALAGSKNYFTLDEMASRIQKQTGAQILSANIQQTKRGKIYRFKVNKKGRVRILLMRPDGTRINRR